MQVSNFVLDAVNAVLDLDMPDEAYPDAFNAQVCLRAGPEWEPLWGYGVDVTVH
jgi:hypothetical protein